MTDDFEDRILAQRFRLLLKGISSALSRGDMEAARRGVQEAQELKAGAPELVELARRVDFAPGSQTRAWRLTPGLALATVFVLALLIVVPFMWRSDGTQERDIDQPPATRSLEAGTRRIPPVEQSPPSPVLSGAWTLTTHVESSSLTAFEGLRLGYRVQLEQSGNGVRGSGHKVSENGQAIRGQSPITLQGTIDGDQMTLTFVERGARRDSTGRFVLARDDRGVFRGRFSSDAAQSAGTVEARRNQ